MPNWRKIIHESSEGTISQDTTGNSATVTNGVYTTGDQTIGGVKTFSSNIVGDLTGNADTVSNGVYTSGNQTIEGQKTFTDTLRVNSHLTITGVTETNGLKLSNNTIYASDGGATILLNDDSDVTVVGSLKVNNNIIKASDGGTAITMDTSNNVTIGNDLIVTGSITSGVWSGTALIADKVPDHDDLNGFVANEHIDWTSASAGTIHPSNYSNTQLTTEEVQDIVGAMFSGNTETRISATYDDTDGTIDLVVDNMSIDTSRLTTFNIGVDTDSNPTVIAHDETLTFAGGTGIETKTTSDGTVTFDLVAADITAIGTIVTGVWNGTAIGDSYISSAATWNAKQNALVFDSDPTELSDAPVESGGVFDALALKQDTLTFDTTPTSGSSNPVDSDGIYDALALKQTILTFGIGLNNAVKFQNAAATDEYARVGTTGLKSRSSSEVWDDIKSNASLDDLSDVTYSGGELTIDSMSKLVCDAFTIDSSADIIIDAGGANVEFHNGGVAKHDFKGGSHKLAEMSDPAGDTAGMGQIWVHDDDPCTLYFTNDSGTDIKLTNSDSIAGRFFLNVGCYYLTAAKKWLPLAQGEYDQTTYPIDYATDNANFVVPYNMKINTIYVNHNRASSSNAQPGDTDMQLYKNGVAYSGNVTVDIDGSGYDAVNTSVVYTFDFSSETNTFSAGEVLAISLDPTNIAYWFAITICGEYT